MADKELVYLEGASTSASADAAGFMRETAHDALMERVDEHGQVVGFSIGVSRFRKERPFKAELTAGNEADTPPRLSLNA